MLIELAKFLGAKFQRPPEDADRNLENLVAEEDVLGYDELGVCLKALSSGKAKVCDNVPIEDYRGSVHTTSELRICRMMWHSERIPPELVRGHPSCCTRRVLVTTWRPIVRSASSATRTSYSLSSWRVG